MKQTSAELSKKAEEEASARYIRNMLKKEQMELYYSSGNFYDEGEFDNSDPDDDFVPKNQNLKKASSKRKNQKSEKPEPEPIFEPPVPERNSKRIRKEKTLLPSSISPSLDPLTMLKPGNYRHISEQPIQWRIHSNVFLVADFHAHLATTEIIGFLAGRWLPDQRMAIIEEAFPCKALVTGEDKFVNVEMDPSSEIEVRTKIEARADIQVLGWYHSHPIFAANPSVRDIENQSNYQTLFRDSAHNLEPFVGMIISPYDIRLPGLLSSIQLFYSDKVHSHSSSPSSSSSSSTAPKTVPMNTEYELVPSSEITSSVMSTLMDLVQTYKSFPSKVNFHDIWKYSVPSGSSSTPSTTSSSSSSKTKATKSKSSSLSNVSGLEPVNFSVSISAECQSLNDSHNHQSDQISTNNSESENNSNNHQDQNSTSIESSNLTGAPTPVPKSEVVGEPQEEKGCELVPVIRLQPVPYDALDYGDSSSKLFITKFEKFKNSIRYHFPQSFSDTQVQQLENTLYSSIEQNWYPSE